MSKNNATRQPDTFFRGHKPQTVILGETLLVEKLEFSIRSEQDSQRRGGVTHARLNDASAQRHQTAKLQTPQATPTHNPNMKPNMTAAARRGARCPPALATRARKRIAASRICMDVGE
jgi:hypothetical protein